MWVIDYFLSQHTDKKGCYFNFEPTALIQNYKLSGIRK